MKGPIGLRVLVLVSVSCSLLLSACKEIKPDKVQHFLGGMIIGAAVAHHEKSRGKGAAAGCLVGALKEGVDAMGYGTPEFNDFAATCVGAGVGSIVVNIPLDKPTYLPPRKSIDERVLK